MDSHYAQQPLTEGHNQDQISRHKLGHFRQQKSSGPPRGVAAMTALIIVQDKQHLAVVQEEIAGIQQHIAPPNAEKLGATCLLTRPNKEWHDQGFQESLHGTFILLHHIP